MTDFAVEQLVFASVQSTFIFIYLFFCSNQAGKRGVGGVHSTYA
jgi:hypothetical protein